MIQVLALQKSRIRLLVVAGLALIAFAIFSVGRPTPGAGAPGSATTAVPTSVVPQPAVAPTPAQTTSAGCGEGAYVTGDLVGDASPAAVYASMCGSR
jgi:hypothetical protein